MPYLRVESGNQITIPDDVIRQLRLKPGQMLEVRFPVSMPGRGLGSLRSKLLNEVNIATQWRHLANQRLGDATILLASRKRRYNGAVYLGGYAIECSLKSAICILKNLPTLPEEYKTHAFDDLLIATGLTLPDHLVRKFKEFLAYVREVKQWIEMETSPR